VPRFRFASPWAQGDHARRLRTLLPRVRGDLRARPTRPDNARSPGRVLRTLLRPHLGPRPHGKTPPELTIRLTKPLDRWPPAALTFTDLAARCGARGVASVAAWRRDERVVRARGVRARDRPERTRWPCRIGGTTARHERGPGRMRAHRLADHRHNADERAHRHEVRVRSLAGDCVFVGWSDAHAQAGGDDRLTALPAANMGPRWT